MSYKFIVVPESLDVDKHDFFDYNPELAYIDPIPKLIKDVGQLLASRIMWSVYMSEDPNSRLYAMRLESKRYQISKNVLKNLDFDWSQYEYVVEAYPKIAMSKKKRRFQRLDKKFDQLLDEVEGGDFKNAIAFYGRLESMYKGLARAEDAQEEEEAKGTQSRGSQQSGFFGKK